MFGSYFSNAQMRRASQREIDSRLVLIQTDKVFFYVLHKITVKAHERKETKDADLTQCHLELKNGSTFIKSPASVNVSKYVSYL